MSVRAEVLAVCALLTLAAFLPIGVASGASGAPAISVGDSVSASPSETVTAAPNETVTVTVWANASAVSGYQTRLAFDPSVVRIESVSGSGDFEDPVTNVNNDDGWVAFNQLRSSETDDPVLAEVTLTVTGEAGESTALSFVSEKTKFATGDGETFTPEAHNGVTVSVEGDTTETPDDSTETPNGTATETPTETETPTATETETATPTPTETETATEGGEPVEDEAGGDDSGSSDDNDGDSGDSSSNSGNSGGSYSVQEPSFAVESAQVNTTNGTVGNPVTVSAVIENTGDGDGETDVRLWIDGNETEESRTVEIDAGETRTVNFSVAFDAPGVHSLAVNEVAAGNVTVRAANAAATETATAEATSTQTAMPTTESAETTATATATGERSETDSSGTTGGATPGFGFVVTLAAMTLLVGWRARRRDDR